MQVALREVQRSTVVSLVREATTRMLIRINGSFCHQLQGIPQAGQTLVAPSALCLLASSSI